MSSSLYVVYDEVAELYTAPLTLKNDNVAMRWFQEKMQKASDPTDYKLYKIGEYDENTGLIVALPSLSLIDTGKKLESEA